MSPVIVAVLLAAAVLVLHGVHRLWRIISIELSYVVARWNRVGWMGAAALAFFLVSHVFAYLAVARFVRPELLDYRWMDDLALSILGIVGAPVALFQCWSLGRSALTDRQSTTTQRAAWLMMSYAYGVVLALTVRVLIDSFAQLDILGAFLATAMAAAGAIAWKKARFFMTPKSCKMGKQLLAITTVRDKG